jgi:predicted ribosome quality control (RQC) complex YloA/Tae2 family protein
MKTEYVLVSGISMPVEYWIGCNAQDNFDMIDEARQTDLWFHVNNESSGHVIASIPDDIKLDKKQLKKIIIQGCVICKKHSKYKSSQNLEIIYTHVGNLVKTKQIGKVLLRESKVYML